MILDISELMLEDWVKILNNKGEWIDNCKVDLNLLFSAENCISFFEPIPLTPEILEKNGFESIITVFNGLTYQYASKNEECRVRVFINDKNIATGIEIDSKVCWLNCDCSFVHELQHALRLCDVGKEIVL
jgi:hypothetical protein